MISKSQLTLFQIEESGSDNGTQDLRVCPHHPDLLTYIKTLDIPQPHIAELKCRECDRSIQWLSRDRALQLIEICPTDDDIDNIRLRLTAIDNLPQTNDEWIQLVLKLWCECHQKGHKIGWVYYQLKHKNAPPEAFKELSRLISADLN